MIIIIIYNIYIYYIYYIYILYIYIIYIYIYYIRNIYILGMGSNALSNMYTNTYFIKDHIRNMYVMI